MTDLFILFTTGDEVSVKRGGATDNNSLHCAIDWCGFTGFLMKPSA